MTQLRTQELVDEISILMAKLNFGFEEVQDLDVTRRKLYLEKVNELFGKKDNPPPTKHDPFPATVGERRQVEANKERFKMEKK